MKEIAVLQVNIRIHLDLRVPGEVLSEFRGECERKFNTINSRCVFEEGDEKIYLVALSIYGSQRKEFTDFLRGFCKKRGLDFSPLNL